MCNDLAMPYIYFQTYYRVLEQLNTGHDANLEELFKLPKIKGNFKGDHRPMFFYSRYIFY